MPQPASKPFFKPRHSCSICLDIKLSQLANHAIPDAERTTNYLEWSQHSLHLVRFNRRTLFHRRHSRLLPFTISRASRAISSFHCDPLPKTFEQPHFSYHAGKHRHLSIHTGVPATTGKKESREWGGMDGGGSLGGCAQGGIETPQ